MTHYLANDTFAFFVPVRLVNPTNDRSHWTAQAHRAKIQRASVATAVWTALRDPVHQVRWRISATPATPKVITFHARVVRRFDDDGLQAACKSVRDGLQDCGLIHHDGPDSGHVFQYEQVVQKPMGVRITVTLRKDAP